MKRVLINYAHPSKVSSKINNSLLESLDGLEAVTVNDLYARYPDFIIDVEREQKLCEEHDVIIFQHPFYWYSSPAILKEWQDLVLQHGWAYGSKGKSLEGKIFLQAISGGGDDSTYREDGYNAYTIRELTSPLKAMAKLCSMIWLPPFTVLGIHRGLPEDKIRIHAEDYRRTVCALRDDTLDLGRVMEKDYLNSDLNDVIRRNG